jgi:hypothetical protein
MALAGASRCNLSRRDLSGLFGSMPGDLEAALHGAAPKRQGCA